MSSDDRWITTRITEIRKEHPIVTEAVSAQIYKLLKGELSERQLTQNELTSIAKALIADMAYVPPKAEAKE